MIVSVDAIKQVGKLLSNLIVGLDLVHSFTFLTKRSCLD